MLYKLTHKHNLSYTLTQEPVFIKILSEIPELLENFGNPVNDKIYPTWDKFIMAFLSKGNYISVYRALMNKRYSVIPCI